VHRECSVAGMSTANKTASAIGMGAFKWLLLLPGDELPVNRFWSRLGGVGDTMDVDQSRVEVLFQLCLSIRNDDNIPPLLLYSNEADDNGPG
jgi:hypothetical protein